MAIGAKYSYRREVIVDGLLSLLDDKLILAYSYMYNVCMASIYSLRLAPTM